MECKSLVREFSPTFGVYENPIYRNQAHLLIKTDRPLRLHQQTPIHPSSPSPKQQQLMSPHPSTSAGTKKLMLHLSCVAPYTPRNRGWCIRWAMHLPMPHC